jgi:hypothetical protein
MDSKSCVVTCLGSSHFLDFLYSRLLVYLASQTTKNGCKAKKTYTFQVHFTLEGEGLRLQRNRHR